jgi:predicted Zn-dependent protease
VREALRKKIKERLYAENDQIVSFAAESSVDYTPVVESVVTRMTASSNISTLRANELDNSWYTGEINKINAEIERRKTGHNQADPDTKLAPSKRVGKVRLNTPTMRNLKDAQDVEAYLERLRQQLLSKLADNDEIQVL